MDDRQIARDLLIQDYQHLSDSFWKNEQSGETRVNWFIGIVAGVCGGLVTLRTAEHRPCGEALQLIIIAALLALLTLGFVTLARLSMRNTVTDEYKEGMRRIRENLKALSGGLLYDYSPFYRPDSGRRFGGLAHVVAVINSLLVVIATGILFCPANVLDGSLNPHWSGTTFIYIATAGIAIFILSLFGQIGYLVRKKRQRRRHKANRSGGIVYRTTDDGIVYLLVRPKQADAATEWVFPKGHIDENETNAQAAAREVREEAGVIARPIWPVGNITFRKNDELVDTEFYLMKAVATCKPTEQREIGWFTFDEAQRELTHSESRRALQLAEHRRATESDIESKM
jgi:bis(5'-nucleosidyl)-tetraphosphatase